ncbi:MAG: hypothetical protein IKW70_05745, partial [Verrucomicrobia bacterium]|nr:hypothetical protein [Verrucomicrobiota bacterium]
MEANENGLQDLQQNDKAPQKGAQKGFFSWLRVHIFDWWMRLLILFLLVVIMLLILKLVDVNVIAIKFDYFA